MAEESTTLMEEATTPMVEETNFSAAKMEPLDPSTGMKETAI